MPMGNLWGALFFVFMTFAAFSTVLAVFEKHPLLLYGHVWMEPEKGLPDQLPAAVGLVPALCAGL